MSVEKSGKIEKIDFVGSVTSLSHYCDLAGSVETSPANCLLWSHGGVLHWYDQIHRKQSHIRVFESAYIHGIKSVTSQKKVVVFGNKGVAVLAEVASGGFEVKYAHESFDDLVLDVVLVDSSAIMAKLLIGYAHNFYDEVVVSFERDEAKQAYLMHHRHACPDNAVLFSLSFDNQAQLSPSASDDVLLVTGDVFGKLTLWRKKTALSGSAFSSEQVGKISKGDILASVHLHEGVIFRVVWNSCHIQSHQRQLLTVSDDRTMRLWNLNHDTASNSWSFEQVFVAWGHISRLWDAAFLQSTSLSNNQVLIASCSEDGTIKMWNKDGKCVSTCVGHNGNVWRIIPLYYQHDNSNGSVVQVVSCGNDGAVKFWDVDFHVQNSPNEESSTINRWDFPVWPLLAKEEPVVVEEEVEEEEESNNMEATTESVEVTIDGIDAPTVEKKKKKAKSKKPGNGGNRRQNAVSAMTISSCQSMLVIVSMTGQVWFVQAGHESIRSCKGLPDYNLPEGFVAKQWSAILDIQQVVIEAHATIATHTENPNEVLIKIAVFTVDGKVRYFSIVTTVDETNATVAHQIQSMPPWQAHRMKTVNLWIVDIVGYGDAHVKGQYLLTASVQGECKLWKYQSNSEEMTLVAHLITGKQEIATSCLIYYPLKEEIELAYLIIGDSRGGVNFFSWQQILNHTAEGIVPTEYFAYVHKHDPVSILAAYGEGCLLSAGHDNSMSFFALQSFSSSVDQQVKQHWTLENSVSTLPIHTPDQVFVCLDDTSNDIGTASIYLTGYHGSSFLVYDIRRSYQLMRVEAGGWKRIHHCQLQFTGHNTLPSIFFAGAAPLGKKDTELQCFGMQAPRPSCAKDAKSFDAWPIQLAVSSSDLVSNCAAIVRYPIHTNNNSIEYQSIVAVGGEECFMKVYHLSDMSLRQETTLSKNASLKSLATANCVHASNSHAMSPNEKFDKESKGIVVGAGGKLLFYIWTYDFSNSHQKNALMPLRKVHAGSIVSNASQDHRILSVNTVYLGCNTKEERSFDHFLIVLADSRGVITIADFIYNFSIEHNVNSLDRQYLDQQFEVQIRYQVEVSSCPLLSSGCSLLTCVDQEVAMLAAGDTKGNVITMLLPMQKERQEVGYRYVCY